MKNYVLGAVTVLISVLCVWNIIGSRNTSDERLQESREPKDSPVAETKTEREREPIVPEPGSGEGEIGLEKFDRGKIIQVARLIAAHPEIEEGHHSNIYGLFGALRKNGGVYLGRVTRLIPASEEDQVRQWGVAETAVKEALFGGQRKTLQVPYFYDDWDIFIKNGGVGGYEADSPWTSYTRNKDSLFVFVTTDGHDNRIFSEKESSDFGISRKVHSISLVSDDGISVIKNFRKIVELFNNPTEDGRRTLVTELFSPGVDQGFLRLGIERLFFDVATNDPDIALEIIEGQLEKFDPPERTAVIKDIRGALSSFDHALKTKKYTYSP